MDVIGFSVEEKTSKKGNKYYVLYAILKDGSKYFVRFVNLAR